MQTQDALETSDHPGSSEIRRLFEPIIAGTVVATQGDSVARLRIKAQSTRFTRFGWTVALPIQRMWAGESNADALTVDLDTNNALIINAILARL